MRILSYIYGSHSLELGEDIELFYVVQDFCLVTVSGSVRFLVHKYVNKRVRRSQSEYISEKRNAVCGT